ncbi:MAG: serine/threonine-protein kinase [Pseudolysinimonas sp.]
MNILPRRFRRGVPIISGARPLGRYKLKSVIGRGSAATVYRAHDGVFGRFVAIKVFDLEASGNDMVLQEKELRLLASLNHPGIVGLLDAGVDTSELGRPRAFLVMELASGDNLRNALASAPPTAEQIVVLGRDLADALRYLHGQEIVHRDISPANVLLTQYGAGGGWRAKFGDFGISLQSGDLPGGYGSATSGTAAYVSPEQLLGSGVGTPSDIYSLGLVLLECFTRRLAFPVATPETENVRLSTDPELPPGLPFEWRALIAAMTSRDQLERPNAQEVFDALCRIHEGRTGRHQLERQPEPQELPEAV